MRRYNGMRRLLRRLRRSSCPECGYRAPGHSEGCGARLVEQAREAMMAADPRI
jgi:hypothetical protein